MRIDASIYLREINFTKYILTENDNFRPGKQGVEKIFSAAGQVAGTKNNSWSGCTVYLLQAVDFTVYRKKRRRNP